MKRDHIANLKFEQQRVNNNINDIRKICTVLESKVKFIIDSNELLIRQRNVLIKASSQSATLSAILSSNTIQQNLVIEHSYWHRIQNYNSQRIKAEKNLKEMQKKIADALIEIEELENVKNDIQSIRIFQPNLYKNQKQIEIVTKEIEELDNAKSDIQAIRIFQPNLYKTQKRIEKITEEIQDLEKEKANIQNIQILQAPTASQIPRKQIKTKRNVLLASILGLFIMVFLSFFLEYISKYKSKMRHESSSSAPKKDEIDRDY